MEKYRLSMFIMLRAKMVKRIFFFSFLPFVIFSGISLLFIYLGAANMMKENLILLILPAIIFSLLFIGPFIVIKLKKIEAPVYEFDENTMTISNSRQKISISWGEITHYTDLKDHILITLGNTDLGTHIIPKKEFKTSEELSEFMNLLIGVGLKKR